MQEKWTYEDLQKYGIAAGAFANDLNPIRMYSRVLCRKYIEYRKDIENWENTEKAKKYTYKIKAQSTFFELNFWDTPAISE